MTASKNHEVSLHPQDAGDSNAPDINPTQDGPTGPFFITQVSGAPDKKDLLLLAKANVSPAEQITRLMELIDLLPPHDDTNPENTIQIQAVTSKIVAAASQIEALPWLGQPGGYDPAIAREARKSTKGFENRIPLLRAAVGLVNAYPSENNRKAETIVRQLVRVELDEMEDDWR